MKRSESRKPPSRKSAETVSKSEKRPGPTSPIRCTKTSTSKRRRRNRDRVGAVAGVDRTRSAGRGDPQGTAGRLPCLSLSIRSTAGGRSVAARSLPLPEPTFQTLSKLSEWDHRQNRLPTNLPRTDGKRTSTQKGSNKHGTEIRSASKRLCMELRTVRGNRVDRPLRRNSQIH